MRGKQPGERRCFCSVGCVYRGPVSSGDDDEVWERLAKDRFASRLYKIVLTDQPRALSRPSNNLQHASGTGSPRTEPTYWAKRLA